mgnify:CR=1 FL=1
MYYIGQDTNMKHGALFVGTVFNSKNQSNLPETKIDFFHFNIISMQQKFKLLNDGAKRNRLL